MTDPGWTYLRNAMLQASLAGGAGIAIDQFVDALRILNSDPCPSGLGLTFGQWAYIINGLGCFEPGHIVRLS